MTKTPSSDATSDEKGEEPEQIQYRDKFKVRNRINPREYKTPKIEPDPTHHVCKIKTTHLKAVTHYLKAAKVVDRNRYPPRLYKPEVTIWKDIYFTEEDAAGLLAFPLSPDLEEDVAKEEEEARLLAQAITERGDIITDRRGNIISAPQLLLDSSRIDEKGYRRWTNLEMRVNPDLIEFKCTVCRLPFWVLPSSPLLAGDDGPPKILYCSKTCARLGKRGQDLRIDLHAARMRLEQAIDIRNAHIAQLQRKRIKKLKDTIRAHKERIKEQRRIEGILNKREKEITKMVKKAIDDQTLDLSPGAIQEEAKRLADSISMNRDETRNNPVPKEEASPVDVSLTADAAKALLAVDEFSPEQVAMIRNQLTRLVTGHIGVANEVLAGSAKWDNAQARLFLALLNKVLPDLSASFQRKEVITKNLNELTREELERAAAGDKTIEIKDISE